jgi:hypothetical protein
MTMVIFGIIREIRSLPEGQKIIGKPERFSNRFWQPVLLNIEQPSVKVKKNILHIANPLPGTRSKINSE